MTNDTVMDDDTDYEEDAVRSLTDYCSHTIRHTLDTGYDLSRNTAYLSSSEQDKITTYCQQEMYEVHYTITCGRYLHHMEFRTSYYLSGLSVICDGYLYHGKRVGHYRYWDDDYRYLLAEGNYEDGKRTGYWTLYSTCDNIREEGYYTNGHPHGRWIQRYPTGRVAGEGFMSWENKDGHWKFWDLDGHLRGDGYFRNGRPTGYWKYWNENGVLSKEGDFENDFKPFIQKRGYLHWKCDTTEDLLECMQDIK